MDAHEVEKHDLTNYKLDSTQKRCKYCKYFFGNVHKHQKECKMKREETKKNEAKQSNAIPDEFIPGGGLMLEEWVDWIQTQNLAPSTIKLYRRKLVQLFKFFESTIRDFLVDSLLLPLENKICFPTLDGSSDRRRQSHSNQDL